MKYMVEVNGKYLVSVDAESALGAEHVVLDYKGYGSGIWGAMAFDEKALKTDTFAGAVRTCETITLAELFKMADEFVVTKAAHAEAVEKYVNADDEIARLEALLEKAREAREEARVSRNIATELMDDIEDRLGKERN